MNWVEGIQRAIDYIEENILEDMDYDKIAEAAFSSSYHFQRVFSILCGYTLGEYIRNRRLSLAGTELATGKIKIIDAAMKYGYANPDSFTKAFVKFHGITPSEVKLKGEKLRFFGKLAIKISLEGGEVMSYRVERKPEMVVTGLSQHFTGVPSERKKQQHDMMVKGENRFVRYALQGMSGDVHTEYCVVSKVMNDGYEFLIGGIIPDYFNTHLEKTVGEENSKELTLVKVPEQTYVIAETEKSHMAINDHLDLRQRVVSEWLPDSGYILADSPEITVIHSYTGKKHDSFQWVELWLPIEKK